MSFYSPQIPTLFQYRMIDSQRTLIRQQLEQDPAFSKRFVGAGHSEEGGGPGGEGTLPSARRARTFRGVWGHSPLEIF